MRECTDNGEPPCTYCDSGCPIQDPEYCPEITPLASQAVAVSQRIHHPAHEAYRASLAEAVWPELSRSEFEPFLSFLEICWEFRQERILAEQKKARPEVDNGPYPEG